MLFIPFVLRGVYVVSLAQETLRGPVCGASRRSKCYVNSGYSFLCIEISGSSYQRNASIHAKLNWRSQNGPEGPLGPDGRVL